MTTGRWCDTCRGLPRPIQVTHYPLHTWQEAARQGNKHISNFQAFRRLLFVMIHTMHYYLTGRYSPFATRCRTSDRQEALTLKWLVFVAIEFFHGLVVRIALSLLLVWCRHCDGWDFDIVSWYRCVPLNNPYSSFRQSGFTCIWYQISLSRCYWGSSERRCQTVVGES